MGAQANLRPTVIDELPPERRLRTVPHAGTSSITPKQKNSSPPLSSRLSRPSDFQNGGTAPRKDSRQVASKVNKGVSHFSVRNCAKMNQGVKPSRKGRPSDTSLIDRACQRGGLRWLVAQRPRPLRTGKTPLCREPTVLFSWAVYLFLVKEETNRMS